MREIPLLCTDEVVRAYLSVRKTQARRPIKWAVNQVGEPADHLCQIGTTGRWIAWRGPADQEACQQLTDRAYGSDDAFKAPCQPGDRVWIRECFAKVHDDLPTSACLYRADFDCDVEWTWQPNIHMPRWAARIVLPVVSVRAERVCDISEADAMAEGVERLELTSGILPDVPPPFNRVHPMTSSYRDAYHALWRSLYGDKHPPETSWCWVIETEPFKGASK